MRSATRLGSLRHDPPRGGSTVPTRKRGPGGGPGVYGVSVTENDSWFTLEGVPGMPILTMAFVPVPGPKTVKNRIYWNVTVLGPAPLVEAGATVLREPGGGIRWH